MRLARLKTAAQNMVAFDTETHRLSRGLLAPPIVCGSLAWLENGPRFAGILLSKDAALETFAQLIEDENAIICGANLAYDILVCAVEFAKIGIDIMPELFRALCGSGNAALPDGRFFDLQLSEPLHAISQGLLGRDPRTGMELKNPETGKRGRYALAIVVDLLLNRQNAKANDEYRLKYHELEDVPIEQWPQAARDYPVDDGRNSLEASLAQVGVVPKHNHRHVFVDAGAGDGSVACRFCRSTRSSSECFSRNPHANLHEVSAQVWSAFGLHAGAAWGFRVDQSYVDVIERHALRRRAAAIQPFIDAGLIRHEDGKYTENRSLLKKKIVEAYSVGQELVKCANCAGTGKMPSPNQKPLRCPDCKGWCLPDAKDGPACRAWRAANPHGCVRCSNTAQVPHPNPKLIGCCGADDEITCDGTGYQLNELVPRAKKEGISYGKDCAHESGDEFLMSYGDYQEDAKILATYVPALRRARVCTGCGHTGVDSGKNADPHVEGCIIPGWLDVPLTLRPNPIVDTGRVSYEDVIQQFPRKPGYKVKHADGTEEYIPSLRECIVARGPKYETIEVPDDYVLQLGEQVVDAGAAS